MTPGSTHFYLEWFNRCESLDALEAAWGVFWTKDREGMELADRQKVERAKDLRKEQLQPRGKAA